MTAFRAAVENAIRKDQPMTKVQEITVLEHHTHEYRGFAVEIRQQDGECFRSWRGFWDSDDGRHGSSDYWTPISPQQAIENAHCEIDRQIERDEARRKVEIARGEWDRQQVGERWDGQS